MILSLHYTIDPGIREAPLSGGRSVCRLSGNLLPVGGPAAVRWKISVYFRSPPRQNGQQEPLGSGYFMSSLRPQWGQR